MRYVEHNIWSGKIYAVSSEPLLPTRSTNRIIKIEDPVIEDMSDDKISLESGFIGMKEKAYKKDGTIHLITNEDKITKIPKKQKDEYVDVDVILYTNNKLMEVIINYRAVKTWYNHRMKDKFTFASTFMFVFILTDAEDNEIKRIEITSKSFLNNFQTLIDLSSIENLKDVKVLTRRRFEKYGLQVKLNKYLNASTEDSVFNKASTEFKHNRKYYNIIISRINKKNNILIEFHNLNVSKVYRSLDFYITGKDPNELHEILSIPIQELWNKKAIYKELKVDLLNKSVWCNVKELNVFLNRKEIKI
jgi:hypothetical protein